MSHDLYAAFSGAASAWKHLEIIGNNLANSNTIGFREARITFQLADGAPDSPLDGAFVQADSIGYVNTDGAIVQDGVATHLALRGDAFFGLEDGTWTRDGSFRLDPEGTLVTQDGTRVATDGGNGIRLEPGEVLSVTADGVVFGSNQGELGRLRLARLDGGRPMGGNRWEGTPAAIEGVSVLQGAREGSNTDPLRGMVELVEASRFFEAQQRAMQASDEMHSRVNRVYGG